MKPTTVYLVGAGPGDPELLTLRALKLIESAEVVVYDRLVSARILDLVPTGTARIFVGKAPGQHPLPQAEINDLLVRLAAAGRAVVRLKGGDPYVFGRGGEEAEHLVRHGIAVEVVPGVTAAAACAAAAGIPLTHRGLATGVRFVTGHGKGDQELDLDWRGLADPATTLVVYMGLANLATLSARLMAAGRAPDTPVAAVSRATLPRQRICRTTLGTMASAVAAAGLEAPTLLIVGAVVDLMETLGTRLPDAVDAPAPKVGHG